MFNRRLSVCASRWNVGANIVRGSAVGIACVLALGLLAGVARGGSETVPPTPLEVSPGAWPSGNVTVLPETFEGTFPGTWSVWDADPWSGDDYWGTSSRRAYAGARSAWSAAIGTQPAQPDLIWYEDFEGGFPGTNWSVGDSNPAGGADYWGVSGYQVNSGLRSAWVAEVGDHSVLGPPNNVVHQYDLNMDAFLTRNMNLAAYGYGELSFAFWIDNPGRFDGLAVGFREGGAWTDSRRYTGSAAFWDFGIIAVPPSATEIRFAFVSDGIGTGEGVYIDDVQLIGLPATRAWTEDFEGTFPGADWTVGDTNPASGDDHWATTAYRSHGGSKSVWAAEVGDHSVLGAPNNAVHQYDLNMDAFLTRSVNLTGTEGAYLTYWFWLDSADFLDYLRVGYYDPTGGWLYWDSITGFSSGWVFGAIRVPPTATEVGFFFHSETFLFSYEGGYIDDVALSLRPQERNIDVQRSDGGMDAWMVHPVDLAGFTDVWMTYAYWADMEVFDIFEVAYSEDGLTWTTVFLQSGGIGGWDFRTVPLPATATRVGFHVQSFGTLREGVYVDEVTVTGAAPDLACTASVDPSLGTEGVTSFVFTAGASGGVPPFTWSWSFGDSAMSNAQNPSYTYPLGGTYAPSLRVTDDAGQTCTADAGSVTVSHAGPLAVTISPSTSSVGEGAAAIYTVMVQDSRGHVLTPSATNVWMVSPSDCGSITPAGAAVTFTASSDAAGRSCTITASATALGLSGSGSVPVVVFHVGPIAVEVAPSAGAVDEGGAQAFSVVVRDAQGHDITDAATVAWTLSPPGCGTIFSQDGAHVTFTTATGRGGTECTVRATATFRGDEASDTSVVTVRAGIAGGTSSLLIVVLIAVIIIAVLSLILRRRRGKPGPAFSEMHPLESTAPPPLQPPPPPPGP